MEGGGTRFEGGVGLRGFVVDELACATQSRSVSQSGVSRRVRDGGERTLVKMVVLPLSEGPMRTTFGSPFFPRFDDLGSSMGLPTTRCQAHARQLFPSVGVREADLQIR